MSTQVEFKRPKRGRGPERPRYAEADIAAQLADWNALHEIAATLPCWQPHDPGRPPLFPPAMVVLFAAMRMGWRSERSVERQLSHAPTWEAIRAVMHARYPDFNGLKRGAAPMNRFHFRRYRDKVMPNDDAFESFLDGFRDHAAVVAIEMGMFDPNTVRLTHPDPTTMVAGDATVLKSRFNAAQGATYLDRDTGEILPKRFDPDAASYPVFDEFGNKKSEPVYGTKFGILHSRIPGCEHERVILDTYHITTGDSGEPRATQSAVQRLQQRAPGIAGLVYDMALRGVHREHLYDLGLQTITKCPLVRKGVSRELHIGMFSAKKGGRTVAKNVAVRAIGGAAHICVIVAGNTEYVRLDRVQTRRSSPTSRPKNGRRYRWYNEYRIPDDPRVAPHLVGSTIQLRLNDPNYRTAKHSMADTLHSIAPDEPDWEHLFDHRNLTESINNWVKDSFSGKDRRAPAVGARRQHFALICAAIYNNFTASLAQADRLKRHAA
jgi:hypothetical protein